jgi:hypothetical protein
MKKILLSSAIVFGSFINVSAQTDKNSNKAKALADVAATSQSSAKANVSKKQSKIELEQKTAAKKEQSLKSATTKSTPRTAMSLVEAQQ